MKKLVSKGQTAKMGHYKEYESLKLPVKQYLEYIPWWKLSLERAGGRSGNLIPHPKVNRPYQPAYTIFEAAHLHLRQTGEILDHIINNLLWIKLSLASSSWTIFIANCWIHAVQAKGVLR